MRKGFYSLRKMNGNEEVKFNCPTEILMYIWDVKSRLVWILNA